MFACAHDGGQRRMQARRRAKFCNGAWQIFFPSGTRSGGEGAVYVAVGRQRRLLRLAFQDPAGANRAELKPYDVDAGDLAPPRAPGTQVWAQRIPSPLRTVQAVSWPDVAA